MEINKILLDSMLVNLDLGVFWKDQKRRFLGANKKFLEYYDLKLEDILGKTDEDMEWHIKPMPFWHEEKSVLAGKESRAIEGECIVNGEVRRIEASKFPLYAADGAIVGLWGYFKDVTERKESYEELYQLAYTDQMTHLPNRRGLDKALDEYKDWYDESHIDFSVYFIDLNDFKWFNDTYGHSMGDLVLILAAKAMVRDASVNSVVTRYGGDEFVIITKVQDDVSDAIIKTIEGVYVPEANVHLRAAIGRARYSEVKDLEGVMKLADARLYEDKKKRKIGR